MTVEVVSMVENDILIMVVVEAVVAVVVVEAVEMVATLWLALRETGVPGPEMRCPGNRHSQRKKKSVIFLSSLRLSYIQNSAPRVMRACQCHSASFFFLAFFCL